MFTVQAWSCIDEWKEGYETRANFNAALYTQEYKNIMKEIDVFQKHPVAGALIETIQLWLYENSV